EAVIFKFTNFECGTYNESWFVFHNCRLKAVGRNKVLLNMNGTILHPAHHIVMHYKVFKKESGYKPWLLENQIDACRFMRNKKDPVGNILHSLFKDFSNINHTCPYMGPQILKDFYLRHELLLLPFPTGDYLLSLRWHFDRKLQFDTNVSFVFVEDLVKR
ncbi:hypothetical protein KR200_003466, partial [Drosophila serrata]